MSTQTDRKTAWKIVATVLVVMGSVSGLLWASMKEEIQLWKSPDEIVAAPASFKGKRLNVGGRVADGSIERSKGTLEYRFKIESRPPAAPAVLMAEYRGLVPDTFKSGGEVVATGKMRDDGVFQAETIMAKCPSKYDAKIEPGKGASSYTN